MPIDNYNFKKERKKKKKKKKKEKKKGRKTETERKTESVVCVYPTEMWTRPDLRAEAGLLFRTALLPAAHLRQVRH